MKHCLVKLRTGDDVIGRFLEEDDEVVLIEDAMVVEIGNHEYGTSIYVSRWAPFTEDKVVAINKQSIITKMNLRQSMVDYYEQCVDNHYKRFDQGLDEEFLSQETVDSEPYIEDTTELDHYLDQIEQSLDEAEETANTTVH